MRNTITVKNLGTFKDMANAATWYYYMNDKKTDYADWYETIKEWCATNSKGFSLTNNDFDIEVPVATPEFAKSSKRYTRKKNHTLDDACIACLFAPVDMVESCIVCGGDGSVEHAATKLFSNKFDELNDTHGNKGYAYDIMLADARVEYPNSNILATHNSITTSIVVISATGEIKELVSNTTTQIDMNHEFAAGVVSYLMSADTMSMRIIKRIIKNDGDLSKMNLKRNVWAKRSGGMIKLLINQPKASNVVKAYTGKIITTPLGSFEGMSAAGKAHGMRAQLIRNRVQSKTFPEFFEG